jgi:hypothetical protein
MECQMAEKTDLELLEEAMALVSSEAPEEIQENLGDSQVETQEPQASNDAAPLQETKEEMGQVGSANALSALPPMPLLSSPLPMQDQLLQPLVDEPAAPPAEGSPTLEALPESRRPSEKTACETCRNSVWFSSKDLVQCYCRVMYLVTWTSRQPKAVQLCDGQYLGDE